MEYNDLTDVCFATLRPVLLVRQAKDGSIGSAIASDFVMPFVKRYGFPDLDQVRYAKIPLIFVCTCAQNSNFGGN